MAPKARNGACCLCGKNRKTHPGVRLHLFSKDARRRMQWLQRINIAYEKNSQAICDDHFDDCYRACKGKLLPHAVPRLTDGLEEVSQIHQDITFTENGATAVISHQNFQPTQILLGSGVDMSAEDSLLHVHLGGDDDPNFGILADPLPLLHQDVRVREESLQSPTVIEDTPKQDGDVFVWCEGFPAAWGMCLCDVMAFLQPGACVCVV